MSDIPTLNEYIKQQEIFYKNHVKYHSPNAFCGTAGEEEMKHIREMVNKLTDTQLQELVTRAGSYSTGDILERADYEGFIDEIDREDFYLLYNLISKKK